MSFKVTKNTISPKLQKLENDLDAALEQVMYIALEAVRSEVVPLTPRITGRLVNSLQSFAQAQTEEGVNKVIKTKSYVIGYIGTKVPYAQFVEYGTKFFSGRHFFSQGLANSKQKVLGVYYKAFKDILSRT